MPASNAFTGFTITGKYTNTQSEFNISGDWDMGWNFKAGGSSTATVYFPASGKRAPTHPHRSPHRGARRLSHPSDASEEDHHEPQ